MSRQRDPGLTTLAETSLAPGGCLLKAVCEQRRAHRPILDELLSVVRLRLMVTPVKPAVKWTLIAGLVCTLVAPFTEILLTVIGMVGAFNALGQTGISDPKILAAHIGNVLLATMAGLIVGIIGLLLVVVAAIIHFATKPQPPSPSPNS